jgi:5-amino-6-(5-phospho-D-ribitylamino)uracil phosphatase
MKNGEISGSFFLLPSSFFLLPSSFFLLMIRLIITDIDGTLLDHNGDLPPGNAEALAAAHERGVRLALATIRKRDSAEFVAAQLGLPCALACQGGATIYDEAGAELRNLTIPLELARALATLADEHSLPLVATVDETNYYTPGSQPAAFLNVPGRNVVRVADVLDRPPTRFIVRGELGARLLMEAFAGAPLRFVRHYHRDGTLQDAAITHAEATKEAALAFLCRRWSIDPAHVLALGDAEADIGMIRMAGVGVALGDAHHEVRAAADWVAPNAGDSGLAAAVRRFVLIK